MDKNFGKQAFQQCNLDVTELIFCVVLLQKVNERWNSLVAPSDKLYTWDPKSTYIKSPPFFDGLVNTQINTSSQTYATATIAATAWIWKHKDVMVKNNII